MFKRVAEENSVQLAGWQQIISLVKLILALDRVRNSVASCAFSSFTLSFSLAHSLSLVYHCHRCRDLQWNLPTDPCCTGAQWVACKVNGSDPIFPCSTLQSHTTHAHTGLHTLSLFLSLTHTHIFLSLTKQSNTRTWPQLYMGPNHSYKTDWMREPCFSGNTDVHSVHRFHYPLCPQTLKLKCCGGVENITLKPLHTHTGVFTSVAWLGLFSGLCGFAWLIISFVAGQDILSLHSSYWRV